MLAQSVIDVILGEATHGTRAERYADMVAIASAISNRAAAGRTTADRVVADKREFNAYGKSLPAGVEKHRDLAEAAWNQVQTSGPTHSGLYYATPSASKNLPGGLAMVDKTTGHQFYSDPAGRSFRTADGFVKPDLDAIQTAGFVAPNNPMPGMGTEGRGFNFGGYGGLVPPTPVGLTDFALPDMAPTPSGRPASPGLGALAPNGLRIDYSQLDDPGKGRSMVPSSGITEKVAAAAEGVVPGVTTSIYSGQEPPGTPPVGTPDRHPNGFAGDFDFFDPQGNKITDPVAMHDIAMAMAAKHDANIGYGKGYMEPGRMHVDTMPLDKFPGGPQWGSLAAGPWAGNLNFARETGIGPTPYTGAPTPTARPDPAQTAALSGLGTGRPEGPLGGFPAAPDIALAPDRGMPGGPVSTGGLWDPIGALAMPSMPVEAPSIEQAPDRAMPSGPMSMPNLAPTPSMAGLGAGRPAGPLGGLPAAPTSPVDTFANLPEFAPVPEFAERPTSNLLAAPVGPVPSLAPPVASVPGASINPMKGSEPGRHNKAGFGDFAKGAAKGAMAAGLPGAVAGGVIGGLRGSRVENPGPGKTGPLGLGLLGTNRGGPLGLGILPGLASLFGGGSGGLGGLGGLFDFSGGGWASSPGYGGTFSSPGDGGGFSTRGDSGWDAPGYR